MGEISDHGENQHERARGPRQPTFFTRWGTQRACMGMFVCVHDVRALPMVPEGKLDFAFTMVCYISAHGRPLTSLSFVCLRARDRCQCEAPCGDPL